MLFSGEEHLSKTSRKNLNILLEDSPFDIFTRNYLTLLAVEKIREKHGKLKILDVGGRNDSLARLLKHHDISILDIREPATETEIELLKKKKYIAGNILESNIGDNMFDIAVSMDMLEHVIPEYRLKAVREMLRISRLGVIVAAPFDSPLTDEAEKLLNENFRYLTGDEHPWLKEHIKNRPLPSEKQLEDYLKKTGYPFTKVPNNNIYLWTLMQNINFTGYKFGIDIKELNKFYNFSFLTGKINDFELPVYRYIYFIFRDRNIRNLVDFKWEKSSSGIGIEKLKLFNELFKFLAVRYVQSEDRMAEIEAKTGGLRASLAGKGGSVAGSDEIIKQMASHIRNLETAVREKASILNTIYDSHGWKALAIYYRIRDKIFPINTKRQLFACRIFALVIKLLLFTIRSIPKKISCLITDFFEKLQGRDVLTPPRSKLFVGGGDFKETGERYKGYFIELGHLKPDDRVLDVGCGIGRMAVPLTRFLSPQGEYWGFDIVKKGIKWCQSHIAVKYYNFNFLHCDVFNKFYNPNGIMSAKNYKFPFENDSFDFVFLTSVFTHMLPSDMEHYLSEISRVMKPGSRCLITFFLLTEEARYLIEIGSSTQNFKYEIDGCLTVIEDSPEAAIAYSQELILRLFKKYDLKINKPIHYGSWCGRTSFLGYQDIIVATKQGNDQE